MSASTRTPHKTGIFDLVRREWYMTRLDWSLRELPSKESRRIRKDLRRSLTDSAGDIGMAPALADLGSPEALAQRYTSETDLEGPRWSAGALAAGLTIAAAVFLLMAYAIGTVDTLLELGGGTRTVSLWGSELVMVGTASELSLNASNVLPALAVLVAISSVMFLLFARVWRLARAR